MNKQVWYEKFGYLFLQNKAKKPAAKLDNKVYELIKLDPLGFCLKPISDDFNFKKINGLSNEMVDRLERARPKTFGQIRRIPGLTPAALSTLLVQLIIRRAA